MIKAIIFDFNGPIMEWDDIPVYEKHEKHRNLERDAIRNVMHAYITEGVKGSYSTLEHFFKDHPLPIDITVEELNEILDEANATMRIIPEQIEYIQELKKKYKIALLSNFTSGLGDFLQNMFKIYHLFDVVVSSHDVKMVKPNSDIYHYTLKQLGVAPEEAVFIDDRQENVTAAVQLGMRGILFETFAQYKQELETILK